ncbi:hypothetical protein [Anaerostipes sp. Marseille-Q3525]|nr:hypothetical protein [Anaerostipes sp. Marseille-Q3525]
MKGVETLSQQKNKVSLLFSIWMMVKLVNMIYRMVIATVKVVKK